MNPPLVTVLIDTYNYGRFIEEAIDSVLSQDFPADQMEVLVVDDGSTDDTAERMQKYGSRIQYLQKPNGGQASAFNLGFQHARGEIVAMLDADDYFLPGKLRRLVETFQQHPEVGLVYHSMIQLETDSGAQGELPFRPVSGVILHDRSKLFSYFLYPTSSLSLRRTIAQQIFPIPEGIRIQADTYVTLLMPLLAPVLAITEPLSMYRVHGRNLYHAHPQRMTPDRAKRQLEVFRTILKEAESWTNAHRSQVRPVEAKLFLNRWPVIWQEDHFLSCPPGRWEFFVFLLKQNFVHRSQQTWPFAAFNCLSAPAALFYGYANSKKFYAWRGRAFEFIRSALFSHASRGGHQGAQ